MCCFLGSNNSCIFLTVLLSSFSLPVCVPQSSLRCFKDCVRQNLRIYAARLAVCCRPGVEMVVEGELDLRLGAFGAERSHGTLEYISYLQLTHKTLYNMYVFALR